MTNPLLDITALPKFSQIKPKHVEAAIDQVLDQNRKQLNLLLQKENFSWESLIHPLEEMDNLLSRVWSPVSHMNSVVNSEELRQAHEACIPRLSAYSTEMAQNEALYQAYLQIKQSQQFTDFDSAQKKTIENALLKFKLNGVALDKDKKQQFKEIKQKLSTLKSKFEHNVLDATQEWKIHIENKKELAGLPEYAKDMASQAAAAENLKGWVFTLDAPSYLSVMTYADNDKFRKEMYTAFTTRASDQGPNAGEFDNSQIMEDILTCRAKMAELLGYENYAELSIADKMAESTADVLGFLNDLVEKSRPQAQREFEQLKTFARKKYGIKNLQAWDVPYYSEKLKQQEYGISQEELKPYFPAPEVIHGLFQIVNRLYGLEITEVNNIDSWHKDVLFYEIKDQHGELRGCFYLDLFARNNKRCGAWMDECISRMICGDQVQIPVAYLSCNLTPPVGDDPALLTHDEVTTLFHEFGHGLHHMLTKINPLFVSGISGVEWDAVELPSQFMENWCWEKEGLDLISSHYQTCKALPKELYEKLIKAKNFQSAMFMVRQLEFALFDFRLHMEYGHTEFKGIQSLLDDVREQVAVVIPPSFNRFQHGFSHIFAGGYSAGYYSYKWAEVLSADAFSKFEEQGIYDRKTGEEFLTNILEKGGSENAMELFKKFRGREPKIDALLRHSGLA
ncbi:MAG: oligopeptidase A [Gammaproteobacteria bacterium]|nr:oligopeptidase A [Gammaproteobacteria bacterium]